ncbi:MAG: site-specific integrase, partial [Melioribacteraceae bacterium]|nr:site-specific integrase [Melioribacteraceae bacterium]
HLLMLLFFIAFYTGMRLGEIVNMRRNWINFEENTITIISDYGFSSKSKKERKIPIHNNILEILVSNTNNIQMKDFVFRKGLKNGYKKDNVSKKFKKIVRSCGLNDKIHFHSLRHSFASILVQKGISLYVVKELLGHENLSTTQVYSHLQISNLNEAIQQFD